MQCVLRKVEVEGGIEPYKAVFVLLCVICVLIMVFIDASFKGKITVMKVIS